MAHAVLFAVADLYHNTESGDSTLRSKENERQTSSCNSNRLIWKPAQFEQKSKIFLSGQKRKPALLEIQISMREMRAKF